MDREEKCWMEDRERETREDRPVRANTLSPGSYVEPLRDDAGSGRSADEARNFDPAAASLGAEGEAVGTRPSPSSKHAGPTEVQTFSLALPLLLAAAFILVAALALFTI